MLTSPRLNHGTCGKALTEKGVTAFWYHVLHGGIDLGILAKW